MLFSAWLSTDLAVASPSPSPGFFGHRSGRDQRDVEAQSPPNPLDVSILFFFHYPPHLPPSEPSWVVNTAQCENEQ